MGPEENFYSNLNFHLILVSWILTPTRVNFAYLIIYESRVWAFESFCMNFYMLHSLVLLKCWTFTKKMKLLTQQCLTFYWNKLKLETYFIDENRITILIHLLTSIIALYNSSFQNKRLGMVYNDSKPLRFYF